MNNHMYEHPATRANLEVLRARGATLLEPGTGRLGSPGEWGVGRLAEPAVLLAGCEDVLGRTRPGAWTGVRVLISAGGTREPIDAVRFIGNRSSGRMGFALADECAARGAEVVVVAANVGLPRNPGVRYLDVVTAAELEAACLAEFPAADVLLMAAAVADFRPAAARPGKIVKGDQATLAVELLPTTDVLALMAGRRRPGQVLIGFAAEHGSGATERAREKRLRKRVDAIVVNDVSRSDIGFDAPENEVTIITAAGSHAVPRAGKRAVARAVLDAVTGLRGAEPTPRAGGMLD